MYDYVGCFEVEWCWVVDVEFEDVVIFGFELCGVLVYWVVDFV